jgi:hypothetical protein
MGVNDDLQTSGFHDLETLAGREVRWTGPGQASVLLRVPGDPRKVEVRIEGVSRPAELAGQSTVVVRCGENEASVVVPDDGAPFDESLTLELGGGEVELSLTSEPTFVPASSGFGADRRERGIALSSVRVED